MHRAARAGETERAGGAMRRLGGSTVSRLAITVGLLLTAYPSHRLLAQDTTQHIVLPIAPLHMVRPMGAFWRSFLLPGWGQAVPRRDTTGGGVGARGGGGGLWGGE